MLADPVDAASAVSSRSSVWPRRIRSPGLSGHLLDAGVVHERAEPRPAVANPPPVGRFDELGVAARDLRVGQLQLVLGAPADGERAGLTVTERRPAVSDTVR